jgi:hypothetical protein
MAITEKGQKDKQRSSKHTHKKDDFTKYVDLKMPRVDVNLEHTTFVVQSLGLTSGTFKEYSL